MLCYRHDGHKLMNSYNIYEKNNEATILYHAIARDEDQVMELAKGRGLIYGWVEYRTGTV